MDDNSGTVVMFPSTTLLSTREEWRGCAEYLAELGYRSLLLDWPGWHQRNIPLNWAVEDDVRDHAVLSAFAEYAHSALSHAFSENQGAPIHVVAAGANATIHAKRALNELANDGKTFSSLTCFSPSWRFYLTRSISEGFTRKLERRKALASWILQNGLVRSKLAFRLYRSKFVISKLTRRFYEDKIQGNPDLLDAKREVIVRDRPLSLDAAMILGEFDCVTTTSALLKELLDIDTSDECAGHDDSDDDDGLLNIRVNSSKKDKMVGNSGRSDQQPLLLVLPQDLRGKDKTEQGVIRDWAEHHDINISEIPGKLFCHEESPALSATVLNEFFTSSVKVGNVSRKFYS